MKTTLFLAFVALLALIIVNRQRVYLRDPLATVYQNDAQQSGVEVFINDSHDVLLERATALGDYYVLVQHWNQTPGTPMELKCIRWMACLADSDHAGIYPLVYKAPARAKHPAPAPQPQVSMTDREVSFVDGDGVKMRVALR